MTKENQEMLLLLVVCEFGLQIFFFLFSFLVGLGIWATLSRLELEYAG